MYMYITNTDDVLPIIIIYVVVLIDSYITYNTHIHTHTRTCTHTFHKCMYIYLIFACSLHASLQYHEPRGFWVRPTQMKVEPLNFTGTINILSHAIILPSSGPLQWQYLSNMSDTEEVSQLSVPQRSIGRMATLK